MKSGYILAGFETLATILDNFIEGRRGKWNDNFTRQDISNFLSSTGSGFLHSYGQDFHGKKKFHKYSKKEKELYQICRDMKIFDNCTLIADSGGYQISIGKMTKKESELLFQMYYDWMVDAVDVYDRAFILDIPPGPGCQLFHDFYDVYKLNLDSYLKAKSLPQAVKDKIIYVHHFRTPKLWEIYTKIMRDNDMFPEFKYHSCGGIVANMSGDMIIPCIIYVLPLIPMINECKRWGRDHLNFHILGGANFRDILFYELFKIVVEKYHKITLNITYDSSGVYKQVMHARFVNVFDSMGNIKKMSVKSSKLNMRFFGENIKVVDKLDQTLNEMATLYNFKPIQMDGVYSDVTNTFHEDVKTYAILYTLYNYTRIQAMLRQFAHEVFPIYEAGHTEEFNRKCLEVTQKLNQGKVTAKLVNKSKSIAKSLDMLKTLDEDFCEYLVNKFLSKDEFADLDEKSRLLKI